MIFAFFYRLRVVFWTAFYRILAPIVFAKIGKGCVFEGWIDFPQRGTDITLGDNVRVAKHVEISLNRGGKIHIGDNVFLGRGVMLNCQHSLTIGNDTLLGAFVIIYDSDHDTTDLSIPINKQGSLISPVSIGTDVWIGAQSVVLKGAEIANGVVVAAGSVVLSTAKAEERCILAGVPARNLGNRTP